MSRGAFVIIPGGDLLSHTAARAVPSAQRGLTSVFGMGTGVTLSALPPRNSLYGARSTSHVARIYLGNCIIDLQAN